MSTPPWDADRPLTLELARGIVAASFPHVDSGSLQHLGSGWEFDAFRTSDAWVFRFPRRAESAQLFSAEARIHDLVSKVLPPQVSVPVVQLLGAPTLGFPYPFAGHRLIAGVPADCIEDGLRATLAVEIGTLLGAIHSVPEAAARAAGVNEPDLDDEGGKAWVKRCLDVLPQLRGLDPSIDHAVSWILQQSPLIRRFDGPPRFVHQDLSADHLIVDPETARLQGVLDWTDAILGDPARDFVFLVTWRGWDFAELVLKSYPVSVDARFRERLRRSACVLSVLWLAEAHERYADVSRVLPALRNSFNAPASVPGAVAG